MEAYIRGDTWTGDSKFKEAKPIYQEALSDCGDISDNITQWVQKHDDLIARSNWPSVLKQL